MKNWRCIAGIVGGCGVGVFTGLSVNVQVPFLGYLGCAILGGVAGALSTAATTCSGKSS